MPTLRHLVPAAAGLVLSLAAAAQPLPLHLRETGFDVAAAARGSDDLLAYTPQYALWSDGATKRRWLRLPRGRTIDASRPGAWQFPVGTRLWKEFSYGGRRVETRYMERRADGGWRYATYVWNEDGSEARLVPPEGGIVALAQAPGGRHRLPSLDDCAACHESAASPVLGISALQLSPDRDPLAVPTAPPAAGDVDLRDLARRGLLRGLAPQALVLPPRIAARTPTERAALGYLHANCGHCHNDDGAPAPVGLDLAQRGTAGDRERVLRSALAVAARFRSPAIPGLTRIVEPGHPESSLLAARMRSRDAALQMPPLGTQITDPEGLALIERWIANDLAPPPPETAP